MATEKQSKSQLRANGDQLFDQFEWPSYEEWRSIVEKQLKGASFEQKLITRTYEDIDIHPIYGQQDEQDWPHLDSLPGFSPYVRGTTALGHTRQPWGVCQELPYRTPAEFNWAVRHDLERGQTMVNLVLDKATLFGLDPDEAQVGDVGRGGVSIATVDDLATALLKIDLEQVPIFMQASSAALPMTALLIALVRRQGKSTKKLRACIGMDSLQTLVSEGTFPRSLNGAYDRMAHLMIWAKKYAPQIRTVNVHGQPYHNGGGNAIQEIAFVIATATEYLRALLTRGLSIDDVAQRTCFSFSVGSNFFMEVAKLRAARLLWAKVVAAFGGDESSQKMSLHVRTSAWNKTIFDPYVNMLRASVEAFAGVIGGCDSLHVGPFDEALGLPDAFSRRIARNTHLILRHESHLNKVIDPAGGSWYLETLTNELGRRAWKLFQEVEQKGGMGQALFEGFPQAQVAQTASQRAANIAKRKDVFVGTNMFANPNEEPLEVPQVDYEALHARRANYVVQHRTSLDNTSNTIVLYKLVEVLNAEWEDTIEAAIDAAMAGATLGELAKTLRTGDEVATTIEPIRPYRATEPFESLRVANEVYESRTGLPPQIFLVNMGPTPQHKARADFATDFFQAGGFQIISNDGFPTVRAATRAAIDSGAPVIVICSTDETYPGLVPRLTRTVKRACPDTIVMLAGRPAADQEKTYRKAGVDDFIHLGADLFDRLLNLQQKLGIV
jgi:methylmalonyl-CoA mutase